MEMRSTLGGAVVGLAVTAAAGCGGSSYTTPTLTTTNTSPTAVTTTTVAAAPAAQSRTVKWVDLTAGDCLADPPPTDPAVVVVTLVDCARPHLAEAYLRAPIPVNAALANVATSECAKGLQQYSGAGGYTTTYLIDSDQDRTSDNPYPSTVICLLEKSDGHPLTGSARR